MALGFYLPCLLHPTVPPLRCPFVAHMCTSSMKLLLLALALFAPAAAFSTTPADPITDVCAGVTTDTALDGTNIFEMAARDIGLDTGGIDISSCAKAAAEGGCDYPEVKGACCATCANPALSISDAKKGCKQDCHQSHTCAPKWNCCKNYCCSNNC